MWEKLPTYVMFGKCSAELPACVSKYAKAHIAEHDGVECPMYSPKPEEQ